MTSLALWARALIFQALLQNACEMILKAIAARTPWTLPYPPLVAEVPPEQHGNFATEATLHSSAFATEAVEVEEAGQAQDGPSLLSPVAYRKAIHCQMSGTSQEYRVMAGSPWM